MAQRDEGHVGRPVRELGESLVLLGFAVSSLGAYVGLAFAVVRVFAVR